MEKVIRVYSKQVKNERGTFYYCKTTLKDKYYDVKFTKNSRFMMDKKGYFLFKVDLKDLSIEKKIVKDKNGNSYEKNILWINKVIDFKEDTEYYALLKEKKEKELSTLIDDNLPF